MTGRLPFQQPQMKIVERALTALDGLREYDCYISPSHKGENEELGLIIRDYSLAAIEINKIDRKW